MLKVRPSVRQLTSVLLAGLALLPGLAIEQELQLDYRINEHIVLIPAGDDHQARLETTVFQPNGPGPFPLIIINHGKDPGHPNWVSTAGRPKGLIWLRWFLPEATPAHPQCRVVDLAEVAAL